MYLAERAQSDGCAVPPPFRFGLGLSRPTYFDLRSPNSRTTAFLISRWAKTTVHTMCHVPCGGSIDMCSTCFPPLFLTLDAICYLCEAQPAPLRFSPMPLHHETVRRFEDPPGLASLLRRETSKAKIKMPGERTSTP